ncbi:EAL domain-containing protein [Sphingomicrobium nitratireducens]|uniref:EAL domain-containing protein n=1 Tax=Sphingomicrobium nitratireducens TaxID=2964666 RepID=UPI002240CE7C|nr:EAL domain-containing protein [Sphingomicrobium nitratireducens]
MGERIDPLFTWRLRDRALEAAIASGAIAIRYQPQIDPASGRVAAVEALARWIGTENGEKLFERAEQANLSGELSRLVIEKAIRRAAQWTGPLGDIGLSVNLLPSDIVAEGFPEWLLEVVRREGLPPTRLTVEIVETGLVSDHPAAARRLGKLREAGIKVAIDDFGTGYASLAYLTSLPIDTLKIDRGLVTDIVGRDRDRIVVRAMLGLAADLGLSTVVEGVECSAQLALLAEWGCDLYQGFLGAEPLDEAELVRFVRTANLDVA